MMSELEALIVKWSAVYKAKWRKYAACIDVDQDVFFDPDQADKARLYCNDCSVRVECLDDALFYKDSSCVRGGCDDEQRVKVYLHLKRYHTAFRADVERALA
jgi:hypothetical protein